MKTKLKINLSGVGYLLVRPTNVGLERSLFKIGLKRSVLHFGNNGNRHWNISIHIT